MTTSAHSARIVRRTGFGATATELHAVDGKSPGQGAELVLSRLGGTGRQTTTTPVPAFQPVDRPPRNASREAKGMRRMQLRAQLQELTAWWVREMIATDRPAQEKLTLGWHDHFATAATKVRSAGLLLAQNRTLREKGLGDFHALAYAMLIDPAMLVWLDGRRNTRQAPNENLSREFMELFALGHGNYTETDVREGARALTGWKVDPDGTAAIRDATHDHGAKTVLGLTGDLDAAAFCDAVLARPASARFVATRLWHRLASPASPAPALLERLVRAYGPGRDLRALLGALLEAPEFGAAAGTLVISPVEWLVGAVRALDVPVATDQALLPLLRVLRSLGQVPFYPPSVAGWPSGQAWLSTASVNTRLTAARSLAAAADLSAIAALRQGSRVEAVAHRLGIPTLTDRTANVLADAATSPTRLVTLALNTPEYLTH